MPPPSRTPRIYHERQVAQMCALHALNNLYQRPQEHFTKEELDAYCYELTPRFWLNPHRSWFGFGNYDVNVIMYAVQQRNSEAIWFDRRRDPSCLNLDAIFGFIMNIGRATATNTRIRTRTTPSSASSINANSINSGSSSSSSSSNALTYYIHWPMMIRSSRHWIALRRIEQYYYNLDSKLPQPRRIGNELQFLEFLRHQLWPDSDHELFIIMPRLGTCDQQLWLKPQYRSPLSLPLPQDSSE